MSKASSVVANVMQQSRQKDSVSNRVQRMPKGHMIDWLSMVLRLHQHNIGYKAIWVQTVN